MEKQFLTTLLVSASLVSELRASYIANPVTNRTRHAIECGRMSINAWYGDKTLLHHAACGEDVAQVTWLLNHSAEVNSTREEHGFTPLHLAAQFGRIPVMKLLLFKKAEVNKPADWGIMPLFVAAQAGKHQAIALLLDKGALLEAHHCFTKETALYRAALGGHDAALQTLLRHGASLHVRTNVGNTPLHAAALSGSSDTVRTLLQYRLFSGHPTKLKQKSEKIPS